MATQNEEAKTNGARRFLSRDMILGADDLEIEEVEVPEWGGWVYIKEMTATEREKFERRMYSYEMKVGASGTQEAQMDLHAERLKLTLCALTICDEKRERLFSDKQMEQLGKKSAKALERVYAASAKLSGMTSEEGDTEGETEPTGAELSS